MKRKIQLFAINNNYHNVENKEEKKNGIDNLLLSISIGFAAVCYKVNRLALNWVSCLVLPSMMKTMSNNHF